MTFEARFGPWRVRTRSARLAITDRGLTFSTNADLGVLILFEGPVRGLDPLGILRHPELTVTVADVEGLADLLRA